MSRFTLLKNISKSFKPEFINEAWQMPKISAMRKARLKRECLQYGTIDGQPAEWNYEWDNLPKPSIMRIPNGRKIDNAREARTNYITKKLEEMPKMIEEERKNYLKLNPKMNFFERIGLIRPRTQKAEAEDKANKARTQSYNNKNDKNSKSKVSKDKNTKIIKKKK